MRLTQTTAATTWNNWLQTPPTAAYTQYTIGQMNWGRWNDTYTTSYFQQTPEQVRNEQQIANARAAEQKKAEARAVVLLTEHLEPAQLEEFTRVKHFHVRSRSGRLYRITHGWAGNVYTIHQDKIIERLCIHPSESIPVEDSMLVQKLWIESDEDGFRKVANITRLAA